MKPNQKKNNCSRYCCTGGAGAVISGMDSSNLAAALNPELVMLANVSHKIIVPFNTCSSFIMNSNVVKLFGIVSYSLKVLVLCGER